MYSDAGQCSMAKMTRTQIHLAADELEILDRESTVTGASRSELIRRAIRLTYGGDVPRRRPLSIGSMSSGQFDAAKDEEYLEAAFARLRRGEDQAT